MKIKTYTYDQIKTQFSNNFKKKDIKIISKNFSGVPSYTGYDNCSSYLTPNNLNTLQTNYNNNYANLGIFYNQENNIFTNLASCAYNFMNNGLYMLTSAIGQVSSFYYTTKAGTKIQTSPSSIQKYLEYHGKELYKLSKTENKQTDYYVSANATGQKIGTLEEPFSQLTACYDAIKIQNYPANTTVHIYIMSDITTQSINQDNIEQTYIQITNATLNKTNNSKIIICSYPDDNTKIYKITTIPPFLSTSIQNYTYISHINSINIEFKNLIFFANLKDINTYSYKDPTSSNLSYNDAFLFNIKNNSECTLNNISAYNFYGSPLNSGIFNVTNFSKVIIKNNCTIYGPNYTADPTITDSEKLVPTGPNKGSAACFKMDNNSIIELQYPFQIYAKNITYLFYLSNKSQIIRTKESEYLSKSGLQQTSYISCQLIKSNLVYLQQNTIVSESLPDANYYYYNNQTLYNEQTLPYIKNSLIRNSRTLNQKKTYYIYSPYLRYITTNNNLVNISNDANKDIIKSQFNWTENTYNTVKNAINNTQLSILQYNKDLTTAAFYFISISNTLGTCINNAEKEKFNDQR